MHMAADVSAYYALSYRGLHASCKIVFQLKCAAGLKCQSTVAQALLCCIQLIDVKDTCSFVELCQLLPALQIVLLGVCWSAGNSLDPLNELSVVPLPGYSISSDNVTMCATACTPGGRIFLGGSDGHLYEILYNTGSGWRQKRCSKVTAATLSTPIALGFASLITRSQVPCNSNDTVEVSLITTRLMPQHHPEVLPHVTKIIIGFI